MAVPAFCNSCLSEPRNPTPRFCITSCGHVFCEVCLQKGKKDECLVCRSACRTLVLSKEGSFLIPGYYSAAQWAGRDKGIPVSIGTILKKDFETKLIVGCVHVAGDGENQKAWKEAARNLAVGVTARPLPGVTASSLNVLWTLVSPGIQSLFMRVDVLCKKYSKEISQVSEFQEKHRKCFLTHHKQKIAKLEESLKKVTQQMQQLQCMKPPEKTTPLQFSSTSRNPFSIPSRKQNVYSSYSLHSSRPSTSETMEAMEVDPVPSPMRKLETPTGPSRLSLISPPNEGQMGDVSCRSPQTAVIMPRRNFGAGSTRSTPVGLPQSVCPSPSGSQSSRRGSWASSAFRTPQLYSFASPSPQLPLSRQPITISGLLQRQQGSTNLGGHSAQR